MRSKQISDAIAATAGSADAGKAIKTAANGLMDRSFATGFLDLGSGRKHTRSNTGPSNPTVGDTWDELNISNQQLYGWTWWWDGAYWRSPDQYFDFYVVSTSQSVQGLHPSVLGLNMYIKSILIFSSVSTSQNASNYWTINFNRRNISGTATLLRTATTSANFTGWNYNGLSINTQVTIGVNFTLYFDVSASPTGLTTGSLSLITRVIYQFVRP